MYRDYLASDHWKRRRAEHYDDDSNRKCFICDGDSKLEVHHRTYKRLWNENANDLVTLCNKCHGCVHEILKYVCGNKTRLWNIADKLRRKLRKRKRKNIFVLANKMIRSYKDQAVNLKSQKMPLGRVKGMSLTEPVTL